MHLHERSVARELVNGARFVAHFFGSREHPRDRAEDLRVFRRSIVDSDAEDIGRKRTNGCGGTARAPNSAALRRAENQRGTENAERKLPSTSRRSKAESRPPMASGTRQSPRHRARAASRLPQTRGDQEKLRPEHPALGDVDDGVVGAFLRSLSAARPAREQTERRRSMPRVVERSGDHQLRSTAIGVSRMRRRDRLDGRPKGGIRRERFLQPLFFENELIGIRKVDERAARAPGGVHAGDFGGACGEIGSFRVASG